MRNVEIDKTKEEGGRMYKPRVLFGHSLEDIRKAKEAVGKLDRATEYAMIEGSREKDVLPQGCGCGCGEVCQGAESEETV